MALTVAAIFSLEWLKNNAIWIIPACLFSIIVVIIWEWASNKKNDALHSDSEPRGDDRSVSHVINNSGFINTGDINHKMPDRHLDNDFRAQILEVIDTDLPTEIQFLGTPEASSFAKEINSFLEKNGFRDITMYSVPMLARPLKGQAAGVVKEHYGEGKMNQIIIGFNEQ